MDCPGHPKTPEQAALIRDMICAHLEMEHECCLQVVGSMPDDKLTFKPEPRLMDFGTLARHIAGSGQFFTDLVETGMPSMGGEEPKPMPSSAAALVEEMAATFKKTLQKFRSLTPAQLAKSIEFFGMGAHPGVTYLHWDMVHLIHHRGQLSVYLRMAGAKVPAIYGPTLDVSFEQVVAQKAGA